MPGLRKWVGEDTFERAQCPACRRKGIYYCKGIISIKKIDHNGKTVWYISISLRSIHIPLAHGSDTDHPTTHLVVIPLSAKPSHLLQTSLNAMHFPASAAQSMVSQLSKFKNAMCDAVLTVPLSLIFYAGRRFLQPIIHLVHSTAYLTFRVASPRDAHAVLQHED